MDFEEVCELLSTEDCIVNQKYWKVYKTPLKLNGLTVSYRNFQDDNEGYPALSYIPNDCIMYLSLNKYCLLVQSSYEDSVTSFFLDDIIEIELK